MLHYSEDPKTLDLYPDLAFEEDLTPDIIDDAIEQKCVAIYEATKGWGSDKKGLIEALGNTTAEERMQIPIKYSGIYDGKNLKELIKSETGNNDFGQALQYLSVTPVEAECAMCRKAMKGLGTNEKLLYSILAGRSNRDMELLKKTYYKMYTDDLSSKARGEVSGSFKQVLTSAMQAAEEEYDEGFHTEDKAKEDAELIHKATKGWFGKDTKELCKIIVLSPPKHLKNISSYYADAYGYTLFKVFEKEFGGDSEASILYTLGLKLKPFETIAKMIKSACAGIGTDELLLTCLLIRYQKYLPFVNMAHEELFQKSIHERVKSECGGNYKKLLLEIVNKTCPEE